MSSETRFKKAFPYQKDVLALPVTDLDAAARCTPMSQWTRSARRRTVLQLRSGCPAVVAGLDRSYFLPLFFDAFAGLPDFLVGAAAGGVRLTSSNVRFGSAAMHWASLMPSSRRTILVPCTSDTIL